MAVVLNTDNITGASKISASGTTYGLTIDPNGYASMPNKPMFVSSLQAGYNRSGGVVTNGAWGGSVDFTPIVQGGMAINYSTCTVTVPVGGYYYIHAQQLMAVTTGQVYLRALRNGVIIAHGYMNEMMGDVRVGLAIDCQANDTLTVNYNIPSGTVTEFWTGAHSTFFVFLIG